MRQMQLQGITKSSLRPATPRKRQGPGTTMAQMFPSGTSTTISGSGSGTVGGGWKMPAYQKVRSTVTGSIKVRAKVRRDGSVATAEIIGGAPPAATDRDLCNRVLAEVRSRRFTRTDDNAPESATAYITYTFK